MVFATRAIGALMTSIVLFAPAFAEVSATTPDFSGLWARQTFGLESPFSHNCR
jgi:hypothetical protein